MRSLPLRLHRPQQQERILAGVPLGAVHGCLAARGIGSALSKYTTRSGRRSAPRCVRYAPREAGGQALAVALADGVIDAEDGAAAVQGVERQVGEERLEAVLFGQADAPVVADDAQRRVVVAIPPGDAALVARPVADDARRGESALDAAGEALDGVAVLVHQGAGQVVHAAAVFDRHRDGLALEVVGAQGVAAVADALDHRRVPGGVDDAHGHRPAALEGDGQAGEEDEDVVAPPAAGVRLGDGVAVVVQRAGLVEEPAQFGLHAAAGGGVDGVEVVVAHDGLGAALADAVADPLDDAGAVRPAVAEVADEHEPARLRGAGPTAS